VIASLLKFIFGTANQRKIKQLQPIIQLINELEKDFLSLTDTELAQKTAVFKERLSRGEALDNILPEAFATVRESGRRFLGQRHYDVQLMGGIILSQGKIAEMKTGEGKTLTATLALYLNALHGKGAHLVTSNDYLAKRDAEWMAPIYTNLGMTIGSLQNEMYDKEKKQEYQKDILHGTSSEFGFDYLRDNMKFRLEDYVQRELSYAIVDEVDSILIDEARTPLIISGASEEENHELVMKANQIIEQLKKIQGKNIIKVKPKMMSIEDHLQEPDPSTLPDVFFTVDEREKSVNLTEQGVDKVEQALGITQLFSVENIKYLHYISQALKAHIIFNKDVDYIVFQDQVLIVDELTGRVLQGRRYSDGLHQAIEAKEHVTIQPETQTLASITIQNFFKLYKKLAGMTGTALTEAEEFYKIYNLDVVSIPTNQTMIRKDFSDYVFLSERAKFKKIVEDIKEKHLKGQPILIGTVAVETSEKLSDALKREKIPHDVLNAKQHEREAEIVAHAGQKGKITIATNMAGRGTDIKLSAEAKEAGGLFILGTERHESRRIDNQLRGRAGRQGDSGESRFYISLEDTLIRRFGRDSMKNAMIWGGMKEDDIIEETMISDQIEVAQEKIEKDNFESRKQIIEYDEVLNTQRVMIYRLRRAIITGGETLFETIQDCFTQGVSNEIETIASEQGMDETNKAIVPILYERLMAKIQFEPEDIPYVEFEKAAAEDNRVQKIGEKIYAWYLTKTFPMMKPEMTEEEQKQAHMIEELQKWFMLETLDYAWRQHIVNLDGIREGINLRSWGQKAPLIEYKNEAFLLFKRMTYNLISEIISKIGSKKDFDVNALLKKRIKEMEMIEQMVIEQQEESEKKPTKKKKK
jgi:preprotein translocase subunit SecA